MDLALNNLQRLICHKTQTKGLENTQTTSLLRATTPPTSVLDMTLNNLMVKFQ